ncbi:CobA protein [Intrasporangium chromatireducens Q5-1]|uniref:uroporphyrinogen-III C-methyltransferase n=1 Tax=Intrasporangium chromatireducens Q5-1 TaxID=584657 RepID=W9GPT1_9MICO|nr:uroporphyrinogen-III C-methyltransferase [Intrasporangium chromatireducens]EWT07042.1 CobA protein [Intrasporangium chromatireducens Q5-1]
MSPDRIEEPATPGSPESPARLGRVTLVGGGPGNLGLLTVAGLEAIRGADVVLHDRLVPMDALSEAPRTAQIVDVGKIPRGAATPQEQINALLVEHALAGRNVVRLKGGDPFVFGRGGEEAEACRAAGVPVRVIPGVSSSIAAPGLAGIPVTHRGLVQGFTVVSAHVSPSDSRSTLDWDAIARSGTTIVILMGVATIDEVSRALLDAGLPGDTPAAVVADAGLPTMRTLRASLDGIAKVTEQAEIAPPAVVVVGAVADLSLEA